VPGSKRVGADVEHAAQILKEGKLVGIPTETVYGLAANALDPTAVLGIFKAKNRPTFDPLIVHVKSLEHAREFVQELPPNAKELAERFWPGPLTLILKKKDIIPDVVTSGLPFVGIRVPNHPMTQRLLSQLDFPLSAPSANPFKYVSPTTAEHVLEQLGNQVDYVLDGGPCIRWCGIHHCILC
jgi:L-threonylcarbamoyladenylate synthase